MSRGFGTTFGTSGTTDRITTGYTTSLANGGKRSWSIWSYRHGTGGGGFGVMWGKATSSSFVDVFYTNGSTNYDLQIRWSGAIGQWTIALPSANVWHNIIFTYDTGSTANNPIAYVDGVSVSVTRATAPSGTVSTNTDPYLIGNYTSSPVNGWDGNLAWFTIWDGIILTASEAAAIGTYGVLPYRVRPGSIGTCLPLWGIASPEIDFISANGTAVVTGALKQNDPPVTLFTPKAVGLSFPIVPVQPALRPTIPLWSYRS